MNRVSIINRFAPLIAALVLVFASSAAFAQAPQPEPAAELTIEEIEALKQQVPQGDAVAAEREALLEVYDYAIEQLTARNDWRAKEKEFEEETASAPEALKAVQSSIAALPEKLPLPEGEGVSLADAEAALDTAQADAEAASDKVTELEDQLALREERRKALPAKVAAIRLKISEPIESPAFLLPAEGDSETLASARELATRAHRAAQQAEAEAYEAEVESYVQRADLMRERLDLAQRRRRLASGLLPRLQDVVAEARKREAKQEAEKARQERLKAASAHDVVRVIAEENEELARRRVGEESTPARITSATETLNRTRQKLQEIEEEFAGVQERVEKVGMTDAVGLMLRHRRDALPNTNFYRDRLAQREDQLAATQLLLLDVEDRLRKLRDFDDAVATRMKRIGATGADSAAIEESLRELLTAQRGYLESLRADYAAYLSVLYELDTTERDLIEVVEAYRDFVDKRVLWIQSAAIVSGSDFEPAYNAFIWLIDFDGMADVLKAVGTDVKRHPFKFGLSLFILVVVLGLQFPARSRLKRAAGVIENDKAAPYHLTIQAFLATTIMSMPTTALLWLVAWRLTDAPGTGEYGRAVAAGAFNTGIVVLGLSFVYNMCRQRGLAHIHFCWNEDVRLSLRRHMRWLLPLSGLLAFTIGTFDAHSDESFVNSAGRFALMLQLAAIGVLMHLMLRPHGAIAEQYYQHHKKKHPGKWRIVIWLCAFLIPLGIAGLAAAGFVYTAGQLLERYLLTVLVVLGVIVLNGLLRRWFELSETRIAIRIRRHKLRRKSMSEEERKAEDDESGVDEVDLLEVRKHTTSLRRSLIWVALLAGVFFVWLDVLPALAFLDEVELWSNIGTATDADGNAVEAQVPVTLANVLLAVLLIVFTIIGARTVPGFLESTVLQRFNISSGIRYAFKSISRYIIAAVGTFIAFQVINVAWSDVQWLVAGFSVGLGFGLQEIFANFVSGLILLIERPVRVGDTVTVNNITGRVTRINMRATTIEDWDRKELIVPNKSFITAEIVNWSLSSEVLRVVIKVGVAYGSDLELVEKTLLKAASEHPRVLRNPQPHTIFDEFGESALNFELRVFVTGINDFLFIRDELNTAIDAAFHENDIEIAFPQRTLWVRDFKTPLHITNDGKEEPEPEAEEAAGPTEAAEPTEADGPEAEDKT